jgi:tetraacyldisaccharide 4'-kinase
MSLLPDAERFRRLIDGSSAGAVAAAARLGLAALAVPYGVGVAIRNVGFDRGVIRRHTVGVPVISVGNLTLGGTGKTPLVAWVARLVRRHGITPAIVSRGYGARPGTTSDEAAELAVVLDGILHIADRNRVAAATRP